MARSLVPIPRPLRLSAGLLIIPLLLAAPVAGQTITTMVGPDLGSGLGLSPDQLVGQTFRVPTGQSAFLTSFSLGGLTHGVLVADDIFEGLFTTAIIQRWNGAEAVGEILFSQQFETPRGLAVGTPPPILFDNLNLSLVPTASYLAWVRVDRDLAVSEVIGSLGWRFWADTYSDGAFAIFDRPANPGGWISPYDADFVRNVGDLGFSADFSVTPGDPPLELPPLAPPRAPLQKTTSVPEPGTYLLMFTGLLALGFVAWRRKEGEAA